MAPGSTGLRNVETQVWHRLIIDLIISWYHHCHLIIIPLSWQRFSISGNILVQLPVALSGIRTRSFGYSRSTIIIWIAFTGQYTHRNHCIYFNARIQLLSISIIPSANVTYCKAGIHRWMHGWVCRSIYCVLPIFDIAQPSLPGLRLIERLVPEPVHSPRSKRWWVYYKPGASQAKWDLTFFISRDYKHAFYSDLCCFLTKVAERPGFMVWARHLQKKASYQRWVVVMKTKETVLTECDILLHSSSSRELWIGDGLVPIAS